MNSASQSETELKLPPYHIMPLRAEIDYYGASSVLSRYSGVNLTGKPLKQIKQIAWSHGWTPDFYIDSDPRIVTGQSRLDNKQMLLASKKSIESYLKASGYPNALAIGLPVTYLKEKKIERLKNSLLVMPAHSLDYTTHDSWKFAEYVSEIEFISKYFEHIYVCVHPSCIKHGYWVNEFKAKGFNVIEGIHIYDRNALLRLQQLMGSFEYITTNSFGSHIAYGAYFGAKVSIYGAYAEFKKEDFEADQFYAQNKDIIESSLELISKQRIQKELSFLFTPPIEATARVDWGRYEVGAGEKKSPREIRELLKLDCSFKQSLVRFYKVCIDSMSTNGLFKPKL